MDHVVFAQIWPTLLYLLPVYTSEGNGTEILLEQGEALHSRFKTKTLVRQLARYFMVDLRAAHCKYAAVCSRSYTVPLPLRPDLILVPVRARSALYKDDGTRAYVVWSKIDRVVTTRGAGKGQQPATRLVFTCGRHLDVLQRLPSLNMLLTTARLIEKIALGLAARSGPACVRGGVPKNCPYRYCPGPGPGDGGDDEDAPDDD